MHITNIFKRIRKTSTKQLVVASAFMVALGAAVSLGLASKQTSFAATYNPDCTGNAIIKCGTSDPDDFINKVRANTGGDIQDIYDGFGLQSADYDRFKSEAREGMAMKNGDIVVDGKVVATDAWSIGRDNKNKAWNWNGYWANSAPDVFVGNEVPVMVLFDENGAMEFAVMHPCGNPTTGNPVKPAFDCKALKKSEVKGEKDTYMFTVDAPASNGATVAKVVYDFGDGKSETKTDLSGVKHTFTTPGKHTVKVSVTFKLPGGKMKTVEGLKCQTQIEVLKPAYKCLQLLGAAINQQNTSFRLTVKTAQSNGATLKNVDFTLDGKATTNGVTTKDNDGNIYKDYTFNDAVKHEISAKVNFNIGSDTVSDTCKFSVTPKQQPVCEVPGKSHLPPNSPECAYCPIPGKETLPKDSPDCKEVPAELPSTGMGGMFGLFAGTSAIGAVAHRIVANRRRS